MLHPAFAVLRRLRTYAAVCYNGVLQARIYLSGAAGWWHTLPFSFESAMMGLDAVPSEAANPADPFQIHPTPRHVDG